MKHSQSNCEQAIANKAIASYIDTEMSVEFDKIIQKRVKSVVIITQEAFLDYSWVQACLTISKLTNFSSLRISSKNFIQYIQLSPCFINFTNDDLFKIDMKRPKKEYCTSETNNYICSSTTQFHKIKKCKPQVLTMFMY